MESMLEAAEAQVTVQVDMLLWKDQELNAANIKIRVLEAERSRWIEVERDLNAVSALNRCMQKQLVK